MATVVGWKARVAGFVGSVRPLTILLAAWGLVLVYAYPGQMTPESFALLSAIRADATGATPMTVMASLWRASEWLVGGQFGLLVLQSASLLAGLYLVLRSRLEARAAAWIAAGIVLFPPVLAPIAVISEKSAAMGLAMLGVGALLSARRWHRIAALPALAAATALVPGIAVSVLPAVVLWFELRRGSTGWKRYVVALTAWAMLAGAGLAVRSELTRRSSVVALRGAWMYNEHPLPRRPKSEPGGPVDWLLYPDDQVVPRHQERRLAIALGIQNRWSWVQYRWTAVLDALASFTPLFAPGLFVLVLVALAFWSRRDRVSGALVAGGALHALGLLVAAPRADFLRWQWAVVSACTLAALWLMRARFRDPSVPETAPPARALLERLRSISPTTILVIGWLGLFLYAYPGYMSYDSVRQLVEARSGEFSDAHPPVMAQLWRMIDWVISGSFGMFLLQSVGFVAGVNLLARRFTTPLAAAVCTVALTWFPSVACVLGVIWKDSLMVGMLALGSGLLLSQRRSARLWGLAALWLATATRHNALAMTLPLVVLGFVWDPRLRWWKRYAIAIVAWLLITYSARVATRALASIHEDLWHDALALYEITGTLRYLPRDMTDDEVRALLDGAKLKVTEDLKARARPERSTDATNYLAGVVTAAHNFFETPKTVEERAAIRRAWKNVVLGHPRKFLGYRWHASKQILQLSGERGFPIYIWFSDIQDPTFSATRAQHNSYPSKVQGWIQAWMVMACSSAVALIYVYFFLSLLLIPFCIRQPFLLTLLLSGLSGEAGILLMFPAPDTRYSVWMVTASVLTLFLLVAQRLGHRRAPDTAETTA